MNKGLIIKNYTGQTVMETAILIMVIVFAVIAMQTYLKRAIQGKMRGDIDQIGSQYDFQATASHFSTNHVSNVTTTSSTNTQTVYDPDMGGTVQRSVTTTLAQTHYDNMVRVGSESVDRP